jgi:hypothetical protein
MFHYSRRLKLTRNETFEQQQKKKSSVLDHVDPISFLPLVTLLHVFLKLNTYFDTLRIGICVWVVLLSPTVLSYHTSISRLMMLSLACVSVYSAGLPSVVMRVDHGNIQCCTLSKVWNDGDG